MRANIVAGNWKMNKNISESKQLASEIVSAVSQLSLNNTRVIVTPTFVNLSGVIAAVQDSSVEVAFS